MTGIAPVGILDYGLGNIAAFCNMCRRIGVGYEVIAEEAQLRKHLGRLILPGVGSFDAAMRRLKNSGLFDALDTAVTCHGMPIMGVCVGMQMFGEGSEEGEERGLGWINGRSTKINGLDGSASASRGPFRLPHMGWNLVKYKNSLSPIEPPTVDYFYFLHSFKFQPLNPALVVGSTDYFGEICSMVRHENIFGVQFHPEKSHTSGEIILKSYLRDFKC